MIRAALVVLLWGCFGPSEEVLSLGAQGAVRDAFLALETGDCEKLKQVVTDADCVEAFEHFDQQELQLVRVLEASRDGRQADSWLVTTQVRVKGKLRERPVVFTVHQQGDRWHVEM